MVDNTKEAGVSQAIHYRNYRRARERAMTRLVRDYPEQYAEYLQEERASDEVMGKTWVGIDRNTGSPITIESYKDSIEGTVDSGNEGANEGHNGGEE
jgi:hypothetical protein